MKLMMTILLYVYWPLIYFALYMPFVVPQLYRWHQVSFWITWPPIVGYALILTIFGVGRSHKSICFHSAGIGFFWITYSFMMSRFNMPSFLKSYEAGFFPYAIVPFLMTAFSVLVMGECGRFVMRIKQRTSNKTLEVTT